MAQLGARFHGMEEVIGSIPIRSTKIFQQLSRHCSFPPLPFQPKIQPKPLGNCSCKLDGFKEFPLRRHLGGIDTVHILRSGPWFGMPQHALDHR